MADPKKVAEKSLLLRVTEANHKDVGRGIARIDPQDMDKLGAEVGDIVEILGKRGTAAKLLPAYPGDRGKGIVKIDGLLRQNARTSLDDKVTLQKTSSQLASKIWLRPLTPLKLLSRPGDQKYIGSLLEGLPLTEGDVTRANLFGARHQDFQVERTVPGGTVLLSPQTEIVIAETAPEERRARISYEDIGGLKKEIRKVREMIELPLKYPQVFERLGIEPPKGILLHGPPGCGKTLIARACAYESEAYFLSITGPEIMGKYYGESEARLRSIFEAASKNVPSILFIDEIDAIAPKREEMGSEKQVERRVVAQLLALMDGLKARGQVIVIGATNIPNAIEPALRRPGRFDREIEIGVPDRNDRLEILQIHTRGMPLDEDVDLEKLAEITHGYAGADLEALGREAAMACLRRIFPKIDFGLEEIPYETILELKVSMANFLMVLKDVTPSALREVFAEIPDVGWDDVGGLQEVKEALHKMVEWPAKYGLLFERAHIKPAKGILLTGPPGTGKTLLAKAIANESGLNFISIKGPSLMSKWVGEAERGVREVFRKAKQTAPCIVFFDEIDSLVPIREAASGGSKVEERVISQFLTEMDGIEPLQGVIVLGATNRADLIDPALLRSGRFDLQLELPLPSLADRREIFGIHTRGMPLAKDVDLPDLAEKTEAFTGADIEGVCREAGLRAIAQFVERGLSPDKSPQASDLDKFKIDRKCFLDAIRQGREKLERYEEEEK